MLATSEEMITWNLRFSGQNVSVAPIERQGGWIRQKRSVWLIWSSELALSLWTRTPVIFFADGNPNKITTSYFLPRCWSLVDNQSGLKGRIVTCRQQSNVQVSGVKLLLGVFIAQSYEHWHLSLRWSRPALTLDVNTQPQKRNCRYNDIHNERQCHKNLISSFCLSRRV